jgi:TPR repeat protein
VQGYYHCKLQNPPLAVDDDPRLISLIQSGQCTFAPSVSFNAGEAEYIKSLNFCTNVLDKMAGRFNLPPNPEDVARRKIDFYLTRFKASIFGSAGDQLKLATDYDLGIGTEQNRNKATELYNAAAKKGVPFAQYAIAARYAYGIAMPKNTEMAINWLNKAITNKPMTRADQKAQAMVTPCAIKLIERLTPS